MSELVKMVQEAFDKELSRIMTEQFKNPTVPKWDIPKQEATLEGCHIKGWSYTDHFNQNPCRETPASS